MAQNKTAQTPEPERPRGEDGRFEKVEEKSDGSPKKGAGAKSSAKSGGTTAVGGKAARGGSGGQKSKTR